ncbi:MAG: amidohydrolase family protein [Deltaproteobacteria bacterium]|nr:amidohydrolase family protein [Deltaproteobacteria bacterium]
MRCFRPLVPASLCCVASCLLLLSSCKRPSATTAADAHVSSRPSAPARPPAIYDSHVHITPLPDTLNTALRIFSAVGVEKFAVKSAGSPGSPRFAATVQLADYLGERMAFFGNIDWEGIDEPGWAKREVAALEKIIAAGGSGIKIFKALGLGVRLKDGSLLKVDDPRLDPLWRRAGELGAIVAWHVADPVAFFKPIDKNNERYDELSLAPDWSFYGKDYPSHAQLLAARDRVIARFPKTIFLGIHLANHPEDLDYVDGLLSRYKNLYVDTSARVPEIGRHPPQKVREFFVRHQDRILFGTDLIVTPGGLQLGSVSLKEPDFSDAVAFYQAHRNYFETSKRQIAHPTPIQGRWKVDAINLPPAVLSKFYRDNAERLIFAPRSRFLARRAAKQRAEAGKSAGRAH